MTSTARPRRRWWAVMTAMSLLVGTYGVAMVASGFAMLPDDIAANDFPIALRVHIVAASLALLLGPWQFSLRIRARRPRQHRVAGRAYVATALAGAATGAAVGPTTDNGAVAAGGFVALGVLWFVTTAMALVTATRRDVVAHRRWAIRSFALAFAAVTLRLYLGLAGGVGLEFDTAYPTVAWACWVPNLALAEWLLRRWAVAREARPQSSMNVPTAP